jgi:dynein regulatory complex protein 1
VLENGNELVGNVLVAAEHLQVRHRERVERRNDDLKTLLEKEDNEAENEYARIQRNWPAESVKRWAHQMGLLTNMSIELFYRQGPTDLFAKILNQKSACNDLLEKKNELIATLEEEIRDSDDDYKLLVDEYHENTAVLSNRMEYQIRAVERLVVAERNNIASAFERQKKEGLEENEDAFEKNLNALDGKSEEQMKARLQLLSANEKELNEMILLDAESFLDTKIALEENIKSVSDQIQYLDSVQQLNEERLDYEIHVLRKHEEEVVLVKSDQKRKITGLQDTINRLRQRVTECHKNIAKEETALQVNNADIR